MNDIIESNNYHLKRMEENELIQDINNLLKNFEALLKLNTFEMNSRKINDASLISELMLNLLLKREGYLLKENCQLSQIIVFCSKQRILPVECSNFMTIIRIYKDNEIQGIKPTNELTSSFLKSFVSYISWFKNNYSKNYEPKKEIKIEKCCSLIKSMDKNLRLFSVDAEVINEKMLNPRYSSIDREANCPKCGKQNSKDAKFCIYCGAQINRVLQSKAPTHNESKNKISKIRKRIKFSNKIEEKNKIEFNEPTPNINTNLSQEMLLMQLSEQNASLKKILETVLKTQEIVEDINSKIDNITNNLSRIQSQSEKLIENAWSEEEIDRIIQVHTTECVENIMEYQGDIVKDDKYHTEKEKLIRNFGKSWDKLDEESRNLLITSKFMFNKLDEINEDMDYSGICVLVTKALEIEIFNRFFTDFIKYLDENYHKNYSEYHTALLFQHKEPLFSERFTMGNIAFVLCYTENYNDTPEQIRNNKIKLIEYCKRNIFSKYDDTKIEGLLHDYAQSIEDIRVRFRNPSAHRGYIKKTTAQECFELVIDVERLLVNMLDSFDY